MLDIHTREFGYTEMSPPLLVREEIMFGTGQLPKFRDDQFQTTNGFWLIPTAEVPLTNIMYDRIAEEGELPMRFVAKTACFRAEAGAAGKDTRGMLRQHQFYKVELVSITTPDKSNDEHERMTGAAETILKAPRASVPHHAAVHRRYGLCLAQKPMTSKYGCRGRMPTAKFPAVRTAGISRRGA